MQILCSPILKTCPIIALGYGFHKHLRRDLIPGCLIDVRISTSSVDTPLPRSQRVCAIRNTERCNGVVRFRSPFFARPHKRFIACQSLVQDFNTSIRETRNLSWDIYGVHVSICSNREQNVNKRNDDIGRAFGPFVHHFDGATSIQVDVYFSRGYIAKYTSLLRSRRARAPFWGPKEFSRI
jgi:hypothetical protein